LAWLQRYCGRKRRNGRKTKGVYWFNKPARFDRSYQQRRLVFCQPKRRVLEWLAARADDVHINQIEPALDHCFDSLHRREQLYDLQDQSLVRNWHHKRQQIRIVPGFGDTRYDAQGRKVRNKIVFYKEPFSRITGELNCLHTEWDQVSKGSVDVRSS
jgi:hypothetical protein